MSTPRLALLGAVVSVALCLVPVPGLAAEAAMPASPLTLSGDLRLRYEWDWDSQTGAGIARTARARYRARVRLGYKLSNEWSFGARMRTVDAITSIQHGKRCRIDLNWKI